MGEAVQATQSILSADITNLALFILVLFIIAAVIIVWLTVPIARAFNRTLQEINNNNTKLTVAITKLEQATEAQTAQLGALNNRTERLENAVARFRPWWRVF